MPTRESGEGTVGDARRFDQLAQYIRRNFSRDYRIADVAGGKGYLNLALTELGYQTVTFDKRHHKVRNVQYRHRFFTSTVEEEFHLLVGMHPDEATDVIITEAARRQIPFCLVPCCVKPTAVVYHGNHKYHAWMQHLLRLSRHLGFRTETYQLHMNGKNLAILGRYG